jgi:hypothetical protein
MAIELSAGRNFAPVKARYKLPSSRENTSVYLLSNSFEYDVELIKRIPIPKLNYTSLIIPTRVGESMNGKRFGLNLSPSAYSSNLKYLEKANLNPKLKVLKEFSKTMKENTYISASDLFTQANQALRALDTGYIRTHIFGIFEQLFRSFPITTQKILLIDTQRYPLYKSIGVSAFHNDIINALLAAYVLNPITNIKRMQWTFVFRAPEADYMLDCRRFNPNDIEGLNEMLSVIGSEKLKADREEPAEESLDEIEEDANDASVDLDAVSEEEDEEPIESQEDTAETATEETKEYQNRNRSIVNSVRSSIDALKQKFHAEKSSVQPDEQKKGLMKAKQFEINAKLIGRITPSTEIVSNYHAIDTELQDEAPGADNPVEKSLLNTAAKDLAESSTAVNRQNVLNTISTAREMRLRTNNLKNIKLNSLDLDKLSGVIDMPKPAPVKPAKITTTNPGAMKGVSFTNIAKEYEDKMMDHDIVSTFMSLSELPDGFYVENIEVTDVSTITSLMKNWKVSLKHKKNGSTTTLNVRIPIVKNGRFLNNGKWYNIGKQDFPIPVLKIDRKKVIITTNYNKITVSRYDTRSLIDISTLRKAIANNIKLTGENPYTKPGSCSVSNNRFVSTVEYDEFAKQWLMFTSKIADCEILFSRQECEKKYQFVAVDENEFCCGMINKVPVVINTDTGLTRQGRTLSDTILATLPEDIQNDYSKIKPGKLSMYAEITVGVKVPLGVAIAAWEGISSLLKRSGCKYQFADKRTPVPAGHISIPFKDKELFIENSLQGQLIFNGFYRINTKAYEAASFDTTIMDVNSVYVDIFNSIFFKQRSQLTTFITCYNFSLDVITKDVCAHYKMPTDIAGLLLYASRMLGDNSCASENNASLYRIRSSEIIPAILHYHLAYAVSRYNNMLGSKSRTNTFVFNPNTLMNELLAVNTVGIISSLNPMVELNERETVSKKGFRGVNDPHAYPRYKRLYDESMIGKDAMSSKNNENVGVARQIVVDPKIESVRGYTVSDSPLDTEYNDLQLASFVELMTPGTITSDDPIRTTIATSQTSHILPTIDSQPVLISNGVDEIVPACLSDEFSVLAAEDGKVLTIEDGYMIVEYKSGAKQAVSVSDRISFNSGSGFYVNNKLVANFEAGESFVKDDVLAYHERFFTKDIDGTVRMNVGPLAKVAFAALYSTYEDAGIITEKMSNRLRSSISMMEMVKLDVTDDIDKLVQVGDEVEVGDPLVVMGLGDTGDKSVDNFLKAFQTKDDPSSMIDSAKRVIKASNAGVVKKVVMYTTRPLEQMSPSLAEIFRNHFEENKRKRKILDKYDKSDSVYKLGTLYDLPTEPLSGNTIKGIRSDIVIEIYIEHDDISSVGDKLVVYGAAKQVTCEKVPVGQEPYAASDPSEEISLFVAPDSILKRMIPSLPKTAVANRCLIEAKRQMEKIWKG